MYLLRKLGIPLAAILVLSVLALITVVLLYENNGLQLPNFNPPQGELPETSMPAETELAAGLDLESYYIQISGGTFNE